jgi:hypothetical protein
VALISIVRSIAAWRLLAETTAEPAAALVAEELTRLRRLAEHAFPDGWKFIRPGFDQPSP